MTPPLATLERWGEGVPGFFTPKRVAAGLLQQEACSLALLFGPGDSCLLEPACLG